MKKILLISGTLFLVFGVVALSNATFFDVAGDPLSSVEFTNMTIDWGSTSARASIVEDLDDENFSLSEGQSYTFDFFEVTVDGLGRGSADVTATLAFDEPNESASAGGSGDWFTIGARFSGGILTWGDQPDPILLPGGEMIGIEFSAVHELGFGNSAIVTATVKNIASVPEPPTMLLLGSGLIGLSGFVRRRHKRS